MVILDFNKHFLHLCFWGFCLLIYLCTMVEIFSSILADVLSYFGNALAVRGSPLRSWCENRRDERKRKHLLPSLTYPQKTRDRLTRNCHRVVIAMPFLFSSWSLPTCVREREKTKLQYELLKRHLWLPNERPSYFNYFIIWTHLMRIPRRNVSSTNFYYGPWILFQKFSHRVCFTKHFPPSETKEK